MNSFKQLYKNNRGFLLFVLLSFAVRWTFADQTRVPTGSMIPTIAIGDHLLVNKMAYDLKIPFTDLRMSKIADPKPGEIIVFRPPHDLKTLYVKRLIAGPGDWVEVKDGFIRVNGKILGEPTFKTNTVPSEFEYIETLNGKTYTVARDLQALRQEELKFKVPSDKYFFVGDNRDHSADSRSWGFADRSQIVARAERVIFSLDLRHYIPKLNIFRTWKKLV